MGDDLIALPLPHFGEKGASPNGTWIYAISADASDPELAGKFLSFMIQDPAYQEAYRGHSSFPGLNSFAAASPLYAPGGPMEVAFEQAARLAAQTAFTDMFDGADPQTELTKAAEEIDADIEDNDGYPPFGGN